MDENKRLFIWLNLAILILAWFLAVSSYDSLPAKIPIHFGWNGQPDGWEDKSPLNFYLLPAISTVLVFLMIFLTRFPKIYNFPQKEIVARWPEEKRKPVYDLLTKMMLAIALVMNLMFLMILYMIIRTAKNQLAGSSDFWPIWISVAALMSLTVYYLVKVSRLVKAIQKTIH